MPKPTDPPLIDLPTREDIAAMRVGAIAIDCWGRLSEITQITHIGEDVQGRLFCCYYTRKGPTSSCSMSRKERQITRTVALSFEYTSHEIDVLEREMLEAEGRAA